MNTKDVKFVTVFLVLCALMAFAAPFVINAYALSAPHQDGGGVTDPVQLYWIGVVASAVVYGLKWLAAKYPQVVIKREWLTAGLYVISIVLALVWGGAHLPTLAGFSDPVTFVAACFQWVSDLLVSAAVPVSFGTLIYNILLKRVFDSWTAK